MDPNSQNVQPRQTGKKQVFFTFTRTVDSEDQSDFPIYISSNKIEWETNSKMNIVKGTWMNGVVQEIRLCEIYRPNPSLDSAIPYQYDGISKIEICTPISIPFIFDWMSRRPLLAFVRFGAKFFYESECYEPCVRVGIRRSLHVKELVIQFDNVNFYLKTETEQALIKGKINTLLNIAANYFSGLEKADITLPIGSKSNLDAFLAKSPKLKGKLQEFETDRMVCYQSTPQALANTTNNESANKVKDRKRKQVVKIPERDNDHEFTDLTASTDEDEDSTDDGLGSLGDESPASKRARDSCGIDGEMSPTVITIE